MVDLTTDVRNLYTWNVLLTLLVFLLFAVLVDNKYRHEQTQLWKESRDRTINEIRDSLEK